MPAWWHILAVLAVALVVGGLALIAASVSSAEDVPVGTPADGIYLGEGLHDPEHSAEQGTYRWTHPHAEFHLAGWGPGNVHVTLSGVAGGSSAGDAVLTYNGTALDLAHLQPGQPWTLQAWFHSESRDPVVAIDSPRLVVQGDNRELGVLVKQLQVYAPDARTRAWVGLGLLGVTALLLYMCLLLWFGRPLLTLSVGVAVPAVYGPLVVYRDAWMGTVVWVAPVLLAAVLLFDLLRRSDAPPEATHHVRVLSLVLALTAALLLLTMGYLNAFDSDRMYQVTAGLAEYGRPTRYPSLDGYTKYGFGLSLLAVPFYWLGKLATLAGAAYEPVTRFTVSMTNLLVTALTCWLLYRASRRFAGVGVSLAVAGTYLLATPALNYGRTFFSETPGGALLLAATLLLLPGEGRVAPRKKAVLLAGVLLGLMIWLKPAFAIFLPVAGVAVLVMSALAARGEGTGSISLARRVVAAGALFAVGPLLAGAVQVFYNWLRYSPLADAWLRTGYEKESGFTTPLLEGLGGLLFSPGKSLFLFAPPLILAPLGLLLMFRRGATAGRVAALLILGQTAVSLLFNGTWWAWTGNFAWGPRLIMPVVPLLAWALAPVGSFALERARSWRMSLLWVWGALAAVGALVSIPGALVDFQVYFHEHGLVLAGDPGEPVTIYDPSQSPLLQEPGYLLHGLTAAIQRPTLASVGMSPLWDAFVPGALTVAAVGLLWWGGRRGGLVGTAPGPPAG